MKKSLFRSAVVGGVAALTIGLAAPAVAAPLVEGPAESGGFLVAEQQEFPRIQNNTEKVDKRDKQRFNTEGNHPYYNSLIPESIGKQGVTPGSVPGGPIVGRR